MRRSRRHRCRAYAVGATALWSVGCYTYTRVDSGTLTPGQETRVRLTDQGSSSIAQYIGPYGSAIDGRVTQRDDSVLVVSVSNVIRQNGVEEPWRGEAVNVPRNAVASVELPRFSRSKSALAIGGLVVTALGLAALLGGGDLLGGGKNGGGSPSPR
jgi:hypothetical protein